jgi:hypothetical protein
MPIRLWQSHAKAELSSVSGVKLFDAGQPFYTIYYLLSVSFKIGCMNSKKIIQITHTLP